MRKIFRVRDRLPKTLESDRQEDSLRFKLQHSFAAPVAQVLDALVDPEFPSYMKQHMKSMTNIESLDRQEAGSKLKWRLRCTPEPIIKRIGPKEVPPELLTFVQESTLERDQSTIEFRNIAEHPRVLKHLTSVGTFYFRSVGEGTERTISGELTVGGLPFLLRPLAAIAEQIIYSQAQNLLNEEAQVFAQFLKQRKPA